MGTWDPECVFGHPAALRCQRQGPSDGARPHGCCRGTMWVPCRVGGYPGKTRFLGRLWVQVLGGCCDYVSVPGMGMTPV